MRLTKKDKCENYSPTYENGDFIRLNIDGKHGDIVYPCFNKLGQLEDIEEELGIDILVFINLVVYGCYVKDKWADKENDISHFDFIELSLNGFFAGFGKSCDSHYFDFKDYGKTWALTKEELE